MIVFVVFFSISQLLLCTVCHFSHISIIIQFEKWNGLHLTLYTIVCYFSRHLSFCCVLFLVISLELLFSSFISIFPFYWHSYNVNIRRIKPNLHRVFGTNVNQSLYLTEYISISHHVLSTFWIFLFLFNFKLLKQKICVYNFIIFFYFFFEFTSSDVVVVISLPKIIKNSQN